MSAIQFFKGKPTYYQDIPDIIRTHKLIRQRGVPTTWTSGILLIPS